jgi:hypothetical protein
VELVLCHISDDLVHVLGFSGHDTGVLRLDAVAQFIPHLSAADFSEL